MSNLENFVKEAKEVGEWYRTFMDDPEKMEGPGSIVGMDYWDGGDDMDVLDWAIMGFNDGFQVFASKEDYLGYFFYAGFLTEYSSKKWKNRIFRLADLFGKLTNEERLNLWKSFPNNFDPDEFSEEDFQGLDNTSSEYYDMGRLSAEENINSAVEDNGNLTTSLSKKILTNVEKYFNQKPEYGATIVDKEGITVKDNRNNRSVTFKLKSKLVPYFTVIDDIGEQIYEYTPDTNKIEEVMVDSLKGYLGSEAEGSATESVKSDKKSNSATESFDPVEKELLEAMKKGRTNIL